MSTDRDESERALRRAEVIRRAQDAFAKRLPKALPAKVTSWDASIQRAAVKVLVQRPYVDEEDARLVESIPVISGVPVVVPGAGGYRSTFPISDGNLVIEGQTIPATTGLLIWCDRSIDRWLSGTGEEVDPELDHVHGNADAVLIVGLNPFGAPLASFPTDHATIGADGGVQIHFHSTIIVAGDEAGAQYVALANLVKDRIDTLQNAHDVHKHSGVTTGLGTSAVPDTIVGPLADVAATQFKAK